MNFKRSLVVAVALSGLTAILFLIASPIVPMAQQQIYLIAALGAMAAAAAAWVVTLQQRAKEESESTDI